MKADLHVHSSFSKHPSAWVLQKLGCRESYTTPLEVYRIAKAKGMDAVTITDHNSIDGCLAIAHLPDVFVSAEVTTYFPSNNCKIHLLVYGVSEEQFAQIDALRSDVFELVPYLQGNHITHALAHPFYSVNDRLTPEQFEQCLLLFKRLELNNDQEPASNHLLRALLADLTPTDIERLADVHEIEPGFPEPWIKGLVAGSDDHSGLNIADGFTEVPDAGTVEEFLRGVDENRAQAKVAQPGSPIWRARGIYGVAYQYCTERFELTGYHEHDVLMRFLDRMLQRRQRPQPTWLNRICFQWRRRSAQATPSPEQPLTKLLQYEAQKLILRDPRMAAVLDEAPVAGLPCAEQWFSFVNQISNTMLARLSRSAVERLTGANPFDLFNTVGSAGALYTLLAPYFISYAMYRKSRDFGRTARRRLQPGCEDSAEPRVAHFTDTFEEINGVARTLNMHAHVAQRTGKQLRVVTCATERPIKETPPGVRYFKPVDVYETPEYPEQKLFVPPLLDMLQFCYEEQFTHIHGATPGPVGLAALAIARILRLPFFTTYHTAIPQYARVLTGDEGMEDLTWRFVLWFYEQADLLLAPSEATASELLERGIPKEKISIMPRGIDTGRFRRLASRSHSEELGNTRFLYVGRVSKEKNLSVLCQAFKKMQLNHLESHLVIVGDGPFLKEMRHVMRGTPCTFTGYLEGEQLVKAYNQCDVLVFPSTTDTFGNVVLEAQACGLPVIVTDRGGPCENLIHGETGLVVPGDDADALAAAMTTLFLSPDLRRRMGEQAEMYASTRSFDRAFEEYWDYYRDGRKSPAPPSPQGKAPRIREAVVA
ncbi:MAG: glycosyltransferase [Candidatus Hydrogenedentes bacterium]|nr:glycosyltransferase [Candidatus Hydrogenedentota bacterium]